MGIVKREVVEKDEKKENENDKKIYYAKNFTRD